MKKKMISALILLAYLGVLGFQTTSMGKSMPKQIKCENGHNMTVTEPNKILTVSKK